MIYLLNLNYLLKRNYIDYHLFSKILGIKNLEYIYRLLYNPKL